ncbi:uncharacterized protein [Diabrotica undecimpunctata]|uniref:uncharacterized protein n=1 Tax=Diabrotica undecimpunctata TaxID=50387 RepID=UPI003B63BFE0
MIKSELHTCQEKGRTVDFIWIPSHVGIPGNEGAALSARSAVSSADSEIILKCGPVYIKAKILEVWHNEWHISASKLRQIKDTVKGTKPLYKNCHEQSVVNRLRLGHTRLTHSYLFSKCNPPICERCNSTLTVKHIFECDKFKHQQSLYNIDSNLSVVLGQNGYSKNLIDYLKAIDVFHRI